MMTAREAQSIGRKKTIQASAVVLAIGLLILMYPETRGDFANGILFYLQGVKSMQAVIFYIVLFGLAFLFGGLAGKEIILNKKNYNKVAIKYAFLIALALSIDVAFNFMTIGMGLAKDLSELLQFYLLIILSRTCLFFFPLLGGWLWAANQMKKNVNPT